MNKFLRYILHNILTITSVLLLTTTVWSYLQNKSVTRALSQPRIMVGDSHVEDLIWRQSPRISSPSNSLLTQYLSLKRFGEIPENQRPKSTIFVLSVHPGVFTKPQENRLNDLDSDWSTKKTGQIASLFRISDLGDPHINWKLRCRLLLGTTQFVPLPVNWNGTCNPRKPRGNSFRQSSGLKATFSDQSLMNEIQKSLILFDEINRVASLYNCEIVWLENPSHPELRDAYSENAKMFYDKMLSDAATRKNVHYLDLSAISDNDAGFRDGDHIFCELSKIVELELNCLLSQLDKNTHY